MNTATVNSQSLACDPNGNAPIERALENVFRHTALMLAAKNADLDKPITISLEQRRLHWDFYIVAQVEYMERT